MKRIRLVSVRIVPHVVEDDGETLTPLQIPPTDVPAAEWPRVVEHVAAALAKLQEQVK